MVVPVVVVVVVSAPPVVALSALAASFSLAALLLLVSVPAVVVVAGASAVFFGRPGLRIDHGLCNNIWLWLAVYQLLQTADELLGKLVDRLVVPHGQVLLVTGKYLVRDRDALGCHGIVPVVCADYGRCDLLLLRLHLRGLLRRLASLRLTRLLLLLGGLLGHQVALLLNGGLLHDCLPV